MMLSNDRLLDACRPFPSPVHEKLLRMLLEDARICDWVRHGETVPEPVREVAGMIHYMRVLGELAPAAPVRA